MMIDFKSLGRRGFGGLVLTAVALACLPAAHAQKAADISEAVMSRIGTLLQEKEARTATQAKLSSALWYTLQSARGQAIPDMDLVYASASEEVGADVNGMVAVDITARVSDRLLAFIRGLDGTLGYVSAPQQAIRATLPLAALESLAGNTAIVRVEPAAKATTNVGAITGQGIISHKAKQVVQAGYSGTGVRVGVLSDSVGRTVAQDQLNALITSGDLPPDAAAITVASVVQDGGAQTSEGTAMMEIIADIAPGAKIYFATAFTSAASFADNIRALRAAPYNCDIIVDDVNYFNEGAFQDGPIAQAVNDVTASGALYFSSAGNSGSLTAGTSGTWEGDFNPGAASGAPLPTGYTLHVFTGTQAFNTLLTTNNRVSLKWSDPLGASSNDYDLFVLNSTGTTIICSSTTVQSGTQDPYEFCGSTSIVAGNRIVVAKKASAATRALRVDTHRGTLSVATTGSTYGHNAAANTQTTAAVYWNSAKTGTKPFVGGAANPTETFNSDGPRKIFYNPNGTAITPGNLLFATNGGTTLNKPEVAAADGAFSKTTGFLPFFGTSAAAPHAAAIAALVKSARPDYSAAQVMQAMKATALDIRAPGVDRDSGAGIVMAWEAVQYALTH
jgi:hypothetical protein